MTLNIVLKERKEIKIYLVFVLVSWHRTLNVLGIYNLLCDSEVTPEDRSLARPSLV